LVDVHRSDAESSDDQPTQSSDQHGEQLLCFVRLNMNYCLVFTVKLTA